MADMHDIEFGGQSIRVPKWASEEQLNRVIDLDKDNLALLKNLFTVNKQSFKTLDAMLKAQENMPSKISRENTKVIKELNAAVDDVKDAVNKGGDKQVKQSEKRGKQDLKEALKFRQAYRDLSRDLGKHFNSLGSNFRDGIKGIAGGDFEGFAKAAGGIVGLGAIAGFAAKSTLTFANSLSSLTNVGSGFGMGLVELRNAAALSGTGLDGLTKIAQTSSIAFRALGDNTSEGLLAFARMSDKLRTAGTQFGLTNTQFNDQLAEEIELRKQAGQSERQITQGVENSFRNLISETTALASLTGSDRREMLRARTDLAEDPALRRFIASTPQLAGVTSIFAGLGPLGKDLGNALMDSAAGGESFTALTGNMGGQIADALGRLGPEATAQFQNLDRYIKDTFDKIDPNDADAMDEFNAQIAHRMTLIRDSVPPDVLKGLEARLRAMRGNEDERDVAAMNFLAAGQGLTGSLEEIRALLKKQRETIEGDDFVNLGADIETMSNKIKAAGMDAFMDLTGADRDDGKALQGAIQKLGDNVMRDGLLGGILTSLGDANFTLKAILAAVGALALLGPAIAGLGLLKAGRIGLGKAFRGVKSVVQGAPGAVKKAPGAVNAAKETAKNVGQTVKDGAKNAANVAKDGAKNVANVAKDATKNVAKSTAVVTAKETAEKVGKSVAKQVAETTAKSAGKSVLKKLPGVSIIAGLAFGIDRLLEGDFVGAAGEVGSGIAGTLPIAGTAASVVIDAGLLARDIAKVYEKEGLDPEEAKRRASGDAVDQKIAEAQDRIKRSEEGENVYWGRESKGIAEDQANIQSLMLAEIKRLNELQAAGNALTKEEAKKLEELKLATKDVAKPEPTAKGKPVLKSDKILAMHKNIAKQQKTAMDEKAAIEAEYGEAKALGIDENKKKALIRSGIYNEEEATEKATIYGYEDEDVNKRYQASKKTIFNTEGQLRKIEEDSRYRAARGREVARDMGLIGENEYSYKGQFVGSTPTRIDGVEVGNEFLTDREIKNKQAAIQMRNEMNRVNNPVSTQVQTDTTTDSSSSSGAENTATGNPNEDMVNELKETNRLLRKQTETIENN